MSLLTIIDYVVVVIVVVVIVTNLRLVLHTPYFASAKQ